MATIESLRFLLSQYYEEVLSSARLVNEDHAKTRRRFKRQFKTDDLEAEQLDSGKPAPFQFRYKFKDELALQGLIEGSAGLFDAASVRQQRFFSDFDESVLEDFVATAEVVDLAAHTFVKTHKRASGALLKSFEGGKALHEMLEDYGEQCSRWIQVLPFTAVQLERLSRLPYLVNGNPLYSVALAQAPNLDFELDSFWELFLTAPYAVLGRSDLPQPVMEKIEERIADLKDKLNAEDPFIDPVALAWCPSYKAPKYFSVTRAVNGEYSVKRKYNTPIQK